MRHEEIERIYTEKVAELIASGYVINPATMAGHQGEIAKVDLKKGDEIIRVMLTDERVHTANWRDFDAVVMTVGRNTEEIRTSRPFDTWDTIWNERLEVIEKRCFYRIDRDADNFSEDLDEIADQVNLRYERWHKRTPEHRSVVDLEKAARIVLPFIRRQPGCRTKKESDIDGIVKTKRGYEIFLKNGKILSLKSRAA